jgi:hypothetical protein
MADEAAAKSRGVAIKAARRAAGRDVRKSGLGDAVLWVAMVTPVESLGDSAGKGCAESTDTLARFGKEA